MRDTFEERIRPTPAEMRTLRQQQVDSRSDGEIGAAVTIEDACAAIGVNFSRVRRRR